MIEIANKDIFTVADSYILCHCISADWPRGYKGIAREFEKKFKFDECLTKWFPNYTYVGGDCILTNHESQQVANLVTKQRYYDKPTLSSIWSSLYTLKCECEQHNIKKLAMPYLIGCGMDRLNEKEVLKLIHGLFDDSNIEVLICKI